MKLAQIEGMPDNGVVAVVEAKAVIEYSSKGWRLLGMLRNEDSGVHPMFGPMHRVEHVFVMHKGEDRVVAAANERVEAAEKALKEAKEAGQKLIDAALEQRNNAFDRLRFAVSLLSQSSRKHYDKQYPEKP